MVHFHFIDHPWSRAGWHCYFHFCYYFCHTNYCHVHGYLNVRSVKLGGFGLMVLTETKIYIAEYFFNWLRYNIVCSPARPASSGGAQGGVGLLLWDRPTGWSLESTSFHGTNVVICDVITGTSRTPIVGAYLPPSTLDHLPYL